MWPFKKKSRITPADPGEIEADGNEWALGGYNFDVDDHGNIIRYGRVVLTLEHLETMEQVVRLLANFPGEIDSYHAIYFQGGRQSRIGCQNVNLEDIQRAIALSRAAVARKQQTKITTENTTS